MNRALRQQLNQDSTIPEAACRPGLHGLAEAGRCSLGEVSKERNFTGESLSGVCLSGMCLSGGGTQAGINRLIRFLIPTDMDKMGLVERQAIVRFGSLSTSNENQKENNNNQSNLNANGGSFGHRLMEVFS